MSFTTRLGTWGVTPYLDTDENTWRLSNTDDGYGSDQLIEDVVDYEFSVLPNSGDSLQSMRWVLNNYGDADWVSLSEEALGIGGFDVRSRDYSRIVGPEFYVKLDNVWSELRKIEGKLDIEIPDDIDSSGMIWHDTVEHEREYFSTWIDEEWSSLDTDKFTLVGRQGGHMIYNVGSGGTMSLAEAEDLAKVADKLPGWVEGIGSQVAMEYARRTLEQMGEHALAEHRAEYLDALKVAATREQLSLVEFNLDQIKFIDQADVWDWALDEAEAAAF